MQLAIFRVAVPPQRRQQKARPLFFVLWAVFDVAGALKFVVALGEACTKLVVAELVVAVIAALGTGSRLVAGALEFVVA